MKQLKSYFENDKFCVVINKVTRDLLKKIRRISTTETGKCWNGKKKLLTFNGEMYPIVASVLGIENDEEFLGWNDTRIAKKFQFDLKIIVSPSISIIEQVNSTRSIPHELIDDICSFDLPGAQFADSYKNGKWDGRVHLYNYPKFPTGLLGKVLQALYMSNIRVNLEYTVKKPERKHNWTILGRKVPRDYQIEAKDEFIKYENGILQLATGAGKTFVACMIIADIGVDTLFLVHTKDLLRQAIENIKNTLGVELGQIGDGKCDIKPITVATVQTIGRAIPEIEDMFYDEENWKEDYEEEDWLIVKNEKKVNDDKFRQIYDFLQRVHLLIIDEAHHIPARMFYEIAMYMNPYYKLGLSATPWRTDGQDLKIEAGIGMTIMKKNASELIEDGYLIQPTIYFINVPPMDIPNKAKYRTVEKMYITEGKTRNDIISQVINREVNKDQHQVLVLVKYKRHGHVLLNDYIPDGIEAHLVHATTKNREDLLDCFAQKAFPVLIATTLADEGLDVPTLNTVILAGGGKSSTRMLQRIGRAIRLHEPCPKCNSINVRITSTKDRCFCKECDYEWQYRGRKKARVYDFIDRAKYLFNHYLERKRVVETEPRFIIKKLGTRNKK